MFVRKKNVSLYKNNKNIKLEPKENIISKSWKNFSTKLTRTWHIIAKLTSNLINHPKIRLKKALLKQPTLNFEQIEGEGELTLATDGSFKDNKGGIGIVTESNQIIAMKAFGAASSFDCEIQAIYLAMKMTTKFERVNIITDSQASIRIIQNKRKTTNPYVNMIRKERKRINLIFINSHQKIKDHTGETKKQIILNNQADKAANEGRTGSVPSQTIPPLGELEDTIILMDNRIVYDKIDHLLYNSIFESEIQAASKYTQMVVRRNRITPKIKTISRNQINIAIRASTNSLPTLNKWKSGNGCPISNCKEDENTAHAIFHCKLMEKIRDPLRNELFTNLQQITKQNLEKIKSQFEIITNSLQTYSPIYLGILPRRTYVLWNSINKTREIQIEFIKFTHKIWIERCNYLHQTGTNQ